MTLWVASAIRIEASLSFLGIGTRAPNPSWGNIIADGRNYLQVAFNVPTEELEEVIRLTPSERAGASAEGIFRLDITPYFASLMDPEDPTCPVRRQVIPTHHELESFTSMMEDSLAEDKHSPLPGLVHRYPDRVLMLVTTQCASYCRYCTRSRIVGDPSETFNPAEYEAQLNYLRNTPQVRDVLLSGGDPLTLAPKVLGRLLSDESELARMRSARNPYGDGHAARRIAAAVAWHFGRGERPENWA